MKEKIRLDQYLVEKGHCQSRHQARSLILSGNVLINQKVSDKPGLSIHKDADILIKEKKRFVSRGGDKLQGALEEFQFLAKGSVVLDIGASTGGFTDCLLQNGAAKVYCVDVGYGQLAWTLRQDPKVFVRDKTNARYLKKSDFDCLFNLITMDVSFISIQKIFQVLPDLLEADGKIILLLKPQFEAQREHIHKGGVVRDQNVIEEIIENTTIFINKMNFNVKQVSPSCLKGPAGNQEYFLLLERK